MDSDKQPKPTILIVPGAWHTWNLYSPMTEILQQQGYKCVGLNLPSVTWSKNNRPVPEEPLDEDAAVIRAEIVDLVDAGHDVLLFLHSYAGIPGQMACKGLEKATRVQQGKHGGVVKMVFCCAFVLPEGVSLFEAAGSNMPPWWELSEDGLVLNARDPQQIFYNDLSSEDPTQAGLLKRTIEGLNPQAVHAFYGKSRHSAVKDVPSTYIQCTKDNAIPFPAQEAMVQGAKDSCAHRGDGWFKVENLESAHSPFLSMPEVTATLVGKAANEPIRA